MKVTVQHTKNFDVLDIHDLKDKNVVMSNVLIRSAQSLTLVEKRILMACLSKMKSDTVQLSATEYAETYDVDPKKAYEQLQDSVKRLLVKYITVTIKDGKHLGKRHYPWTSHVGYVEGKGYVEIRFNQEIMPFLLDLKGHFTQYQLQQAASLRSIHSWRLMELLQQMRGKQPEGYLHIDIDEFHLAMENTPSYIKNFNLCKSRVIEPAIKELMEKDGWLIDWQVLKLGRRIVALRFDFEKSPQYSLDFTGKSLSEQRAHKAKELLRQSQSQNDEERRKHGLPVYEPGTNWAPAIR